MRNSLIYLNHHQSDMVEYNQCQAMLKQLYELGIPGCNDEFTAYRILLLLHGMNRSGQQFIIIYDFYSLIISFSHRRFKFIGRSTDKHTEECNCDQTCS